MCLAIYLDHLSQSTRILTQKYSKIKVLNDVIKKTDDNHNPNQQQKAHFLVNSPFYITNNL